MTKFQFPKGKGETPPARIASEIMKARKQSKGGQLASFAKGGKRDKK